MITINENTLALTLIEIIKLYVEDDYVKENIYTDLVQYLMEEDVIFNLKKLKGIDSVFDRVLDEEYVVEELDLEDDE